MLPQVCGGRGQAGWICPHSHCHCQFLLDIVLTDKTSTLTKSQGGLTLFQAFKIQFSPNKKFSALVFYGKKATGSLRFFKPPPKKVSCASAPSSSVFRLTEANDAETTTCLQSPTHIHEHLLPSQRLRFYRYHRTSSVTSVGQPAE